jgi:hypothetical protein
MITLRMMRWAGHIARMGEMRNAYKTLIVKPERKRPLHDFGDNFKMEIRCIISTPPKFSVRSLNEIHYRN